jgi:acyl dehydratase
LSAGTDVLQVPLRELPAFAGKPLGVSPWRLIDQAEVDAFAQLTGDHQWIHTDAERARREGLGGTILHGHLTLSLVPSFIRGTISVVGYNRAINYGLDKVRFPAPAPVGTRLRGHVQLESVQAIPGAQHAVFITSVEAEGVARPVCVATTVSRFYG